MTDDEVAFYEQNGWVKLDGLITPELTAELMRIGLETGDRPGAWESMATAPGLEPFRTMVFGERMGRNAARLVNRRRLTDTDIGLRYRNDHLVRRDRGEQHGTPYHQDSAEHGSDRIGELQFWLALEEVTPEMGAMRFLSGVHREGPLGSGALSSQDLLVQYPKLTDLYEMSPPFHYQPGDATVHHGYMVHGAPPNCTDRPRWSYIFSYTPADTRWWNGVVKNWGSERRTLCEEQNPIVASV
ncbi:MAG TPA: phytanoyl-CoA dioxygenase family protein [Mycobacteriales bacterium]|nr:phytanoyl-CoA dioxygenase family protein [Mycobacteriales bacterium]